MLIGAGLVSLEGCAPTTSGQPAPGVLLVVVDALRADHLEPLGYDRSTMPAVVGLAEEGVIFSRTFSAAPELIPAHVAVLTGCDPNLAYMGISKQFQIPTPNRWWIPSRVPHLAVEFLAAGRATAAFIDHPQILDRSGFAEGFEVFRQVGPEDNRRRDERGAEQLCDDFIDWISELDRDETWFAYIHLNDLEHAWSFNNPQWDSFFPSRPELSTSPPVGLSNEVFHAIPRSRWRAGSQSMGDYQARYDGSIRHIDSELRRLVGQLDAMGRWDNTSFSLLGSFGLQFGEAGLIIDHGLYSEADLHVPWILRPGAARRAAQPLELGGLRDNLVSTLDVAATLLDLEGIAQPAGIHGISHMPLLRNEPYAGREFSFASCGRIAGYSVMDSAWTLEHFLPGASLEGRAKFSWFGEADPVEGGEELLLYPQGRRRPSALEVRDGPEEVRVRLRTAALQWFGNIERARKLSQRVNWNGVDEDKSISDDLIELGYLGDQP